MATLEMWGKLTAVHENKAGEVDEVAIRLDNGGTLYLKMNKFESSLTVEGVGDPVLVEVAW